MTREEMEMIRDCLEPGSLAALGMEHLFSVADERTGQENPDD